MKRLILFVSIIISISLFGCSSQKKEANEDKSLNLYPVETFVSKRLWVKFTFIDEQSPETAPNLILSGDSIMVAYHTLTVLKKDPNISAEKFVLSLISGMKNDCLFKIKNSVIDSPLMSWYEKITLSNKSSSDFMWFGEWSDDMHCKNEYSIENSQKEFLYNPEVPGKIIFLDLWQSNWLKWTNEINDRYLTINIF